MAGARLKGQGEKAGRWSGESKHQELVAVGRAAARVANDERASVAKAVSDAPTPATETKRTTVSASQRG